MKKMRSLVYVCLLFLLLNGCSLLNLPAETVKTVGTVVKTTGKVVEVAGPAVITTLQTGSKAAEAGGKVAETIIKTPGVKEAIASKIKP